MDNKQLQPVSIAPSIVSEVDDYDLETANYEDLVQIGINVSETKISTNWILGKLGDVASGKYGDLKKYASDIGQRYEVLQQYVNVYRKFTQEDPAFTPDYFKGSVPWGVLQIAAYSSDSPKQLVEKLQDEGIRTVEGAYKKIKENETGVRIPVKPKITLHWDPEIRKFKIKIDFASLPLIDWSEVKENLIDYLGALD